MEFVHNVFKTVLFVLLFPKLVAFCIDLRKHDFSSATDYCLSHIKY